MKLIELNINEILLLDEFKFQNNYNNIDYLNKKALKTAAFKEQLNLLMLATRKIEKFHSFFHFEQSFFHLQLLKRLLQNRKIKEAEEQFKLCIFQDPLNKEAKAIFSSDKATEEVKPYERIYNNFSDYLSFASEEKTSNTKEKGYWQDYLEYQKSNNENILKIIIDKVRHHHLSYHQEAAKLYINRAIIHYKLNHIDLAKNDLRKANYLDKDLKEKTYYFQVQHITTIRE